MLKKMIALPLPLTLRTAKELHANVELAGGAMVVVTAGTAIYFAFTYVWFWFAIAAAIVLPIWVLDLLLVAHIRTMESPPKRAEDEWQRS